VLGDVFRIPTAITEKRSCRVVAEAARVGEAGRRPAACVAPAGEAGVAAPARHVRVDAEARVAEAHLEVLLVLRRDGAVAVAGARDRDSEGRKAQDGEERTNADRHESLPPRAAMATRMPGNARAIPGIYGPRATDATRRPLGWARRARRGALRST